jgi:hypothetical protein
MQDPNHYATFFVSSGRCGTQWLADKLSTHYNDLAVVRHEPFKKEYQPRRYFAAYHRKEEVALSPELEAHLRGIEEILRRFQYVETGWPVYGALPLFLRRLEGRARVVHLYRNPFEAAASLATHRVYNRGEWSEAVSITPCEDGVVQGDLRGPRWEAMPEYEKCLFWWTEINHFAFVLRNDFKTVPWLSIRFEEIFQNEGREALHQLLAFLSLPVREGFINSRVERTDKYHFRTNQRLDAIDLGMYPTAAKVIHRLGYDNDPRTMQRIRKRYRQGVLRRWGSRARRGLHSWLVQRGRQPRAGG